MFLDNFYKEKNILVTGHTGFKGSWLISWLHKLGANVHGFALNPEREEDLFNMISGQRLCVSVIGDIRNGEHIKEVVTKIQPDVIFHLAAQPLVRLAYEKPIETYQTNVIGTGHLLNSLKNLEKPCATVVVTTDKVYENKEWEYPYRECDRLGGHDPYSSSKACTELLTSSFRRSFYPMDKFEEHRISIASARAGNVIGGGDWAKDRIIPDIVRALSKSIDIKVRNPLAIRPWQHVLEPLLGYLKLGKMLYEEPEKHSSSWNFGPYFKDTITVEDLVKKAIYAWGSGHYILPQKHEALHEASLLSLDISKSLKSLNWEPNYTSSKAIDLTMYWYKQHILYSANPSDLVFEQIINYQKELHPI